MDLKPVDRSFENEDLPTQSELYCLRPGLFVKVALKTGERFWCMLTSAKRENGTYAALVETKPVTAPNVRRGDLVILEKRHILEVV